MYHDVIDVRCVGDFTLELTFEDQKTGRIDSRPLIAKGGAFDQLRDPETFRRVSVNHELGVVTWENEIDIAPETAYSLATGSPLPAWMNSEKE